MAQTTFDWGVPARSYPNLGLAIALATLAAVVVVVAAAALAAAMGLHPVVGAVTGALLVAGFAALRGRMALRRARARRIPSDAEPRLSSLARGLAADLDMRCPQLWLYEGRGPNALVCAGAVAVSRAALTDLNRTELEAVVAHCLVRLKARSTRIATLASLSHALARSIGTIVGPTEDARAAALTRYPPALVAAIAKAAPAQGRYGPFYFVADGPVHAHADARIKALSDL
jgi:Zn-dependent protease with chaperone function